MVSSGRNSGGGYSSKLLAKAVLLFGDPSLEAVWNACALYIDWYDNSILIKLNLLHTVYIADSLSSSGTVLEYSTIPTDSRSSVSS